MLINETSFFNDTEIGQSNDSAVVAEVRQFIQQYEEEYLKTILGYSTWKAFNAALVSGTPAQKWLDLLNGCEYIDVKGVLKKWDGLVSLPEATVLTQQSWPADIEITVDGPGEFDPIAGTRSYTNLDLPSIDSTWRLERRGFAQMKEREFIRHDDGTGFDLPITDIFSSGDVFIIQFKDPIAVAVEGVTAMTRISPITFYVYYWYMRDNSSFSTGGGEAIVNKHNSRVVTNRRKQVNAWNKMVELNVKLREMMRTRYLDYDEFYVYSKWNRYCRNHNEDFWNLFEPINLLNI